LKNEVRASLILSVVLVLLTGCGGPSNTTAHNSTPLSAGNINLIFVVSEDLAYNASGDVDGSTANLTRQGLQRSLQLASYIKKTVVGNSNVSGIYALEPMTHLQTGNSYPDMGGLVSVQQLAMLSKMTQPINPLSSTYYTANSFQINVSYAIGQTVNGVASPMINCQGCQGLDFADQGGDNEALVKSILGYDVPGYYIFSSPWETTKNLLTAINVANGYNLTIPSDYQGPNFIYAISVTPSGSASLVTYNSNLTPPATYPVLTPEPSFTHPCQAMPFSIAATAPQPPVISNTNEILYLMRHAEAHPVGTWENGNFVAAGQWRSLALPNALRGKIHPDQVYSIDPAQAIPSGYSDWSYVRPALTVAPYVIANNLPYRLIADFELDEIPAVIANTNSFFFNEAQFSNHAILLAWEHEHFAPTVNALLKSYGSNKTVPDWGGDDYDSIWTVKIDAAGNLTVDNSVCEGIDSAKLPVVAPQF
jgi:hypothetical protein